MTRAAFIDLVAPLAVAECRARGYGNAQAWTCVAQACCESANGTSELATKANALFGIKATSSWKGKTHRKETKECYDGKTYTVVTAVFRAYGSFAESVKDYFDFLNGSRYRASLTAQTVRECVEKIKAGGYATSPTYVKTIVGVYESNRKQIEGYTVGGTKMGIFSPVCTQIFDFGAKHSNPRSRDGIAAPIMIIPHHAATTADALSVAKYHLYKTSDVNGASAHAYISDTMIVGAVSEDRRAWTTGGVPQGGKSGRWADFRAITIEVSNNKKGNPKSGKGWTISDASYRSLVRYCADVCKRYGFLPHYDGTQTGTLCMHKQFSKTACPGEHLERLITSGQLEKDILKEMGRTPDPQPTPKVVWRAQIGAFRSLASAQSYAAGFTKVTGLTATVKHEGSYYKVQHPKDGFETKSDAELSAGALRKMGYPGAFATAGGA